MPADSPNGDATAGVHPHPVTTRLGAATRVNATPQSSLAYPPPSLGCSCLCGSPLVTGVSASTSVSAHVRHPPHPHPVVEMALHVQAKPRADAAMGNIPGHVIDGLLHMKCDVFTQQVF